MSVQIKDRVLATTHMWVINFDKDETRRLVKKNFCFEQVFGALMKLYNPDAVGVHFCDKPVKHIDNGKPGRALDLSTDELVDIVWKLDKSDDCPDFVISSRELINVPVTSLSNKDVVPLGSRLDGLEKTVASLVKSIEDLKNNQAKEVPNIVVDQEVQPSFSAVAATAASNVAKNRVVSTKVVGNNRYNSEYPEMD